MSRKPEFRNITKESSLEQLVPGDKVKVFHYDYILPKWMVYLEMDSGKGNISFIEVPNDRRKADYSIDLDYSFNIWCSVIKNLQFNDGIYLPSFHTTLIKIYHGSEKYRATKALIDLWH